MPSTRLCSRCLTPPRTRNMPRVTVVTPNYNHARYLPERIDSILAQTFQDFELLILDNASTDNSREVIESYTRHHNVRATFNAKNNGSPFKQWNLGLSQAKGEYVWLAEADDYADNALLETLVDRLDRHPNVGLAVCQSWTVDQDSKLLGNYRDLQEYQNHSSHWREDYVNAGHDECKNYLFWHNTIPTRVQCSGDVKSSNAWVGRPPICACAVIGWRTSTPSSCRTSRLSQRP